MVNKRGACASWCDEGLQVWLVENAGRLLISDVHTASGAGHKGKNRQVKCIDVKNTDVDAAQVRSGGAFAGALVRGSLFR